MPVITLTGLDILFISRKQQRACYTTDMLYSEQNKINHILNSKHIRP